MDDFPDPPGSPHHYEQQLEDDQQQYRPRPPRRQPQSPHRDGGGGSADFGGGPRPPPLRSIFGAGRAYLYDGPAAAVRDSGLVGVAVALLAIVVFQFRGAIITSVRRTRDRIADDWYEGGPFLILFDLYDYVRSYLLVAFDALFRLRLIFPTIHQYGGIDDDAAGGVAGRGVGLVRRGGGVAGDGGSPGRGRGAQRRRMYERGSASAAMPDLEDVPPPPRRPRQGDDGQAAAGLATTMNGGDSNGQRRTEGGRRGPCRLCGVVHHSRGRSHRLSNGGYCHEIEPAFLREEDYPPGWLVYDAVHGIIPKEVADQRRRDMMSAEKEKKKERPGIPPPPQSGDAGACQQTSE